MNTGDLSRIFEFTAVCLKSMRKVLFLLSCLLLSHSDDAWAGSVITANLPAGTAIVNINAQQDGAAGQNGDGSLFYSPFSTQGGASLLTLPVTAGTYTFTVIDPAAAAAQFPALTQAQLGSLYTAWTYNSPWTTNYVVFDSSAATNSNESQLFDGSPDLTNYGDAQSAYNAAVAGGYANEIRTGPLGRDGTVFTTSYTVAADTTLVFAVPDYGLSDNAGGVSVIVQTVNGRIAGPGNVRLTTATTATTEAVGSVVLSVSRTGGSGGAFSVNYTTADDTAIAGTDYQAVRGTLSWADGDATSKTITVPIIDRSLTSGSTAFLVNLYAAAGGTPLASPVQEAVTILDTESAVGDLLSVSLLSPPNGVTLTQNVPVTVQADVEALNDTLANAEFYAVDSAGNSTDLGSFVGESGQATWVPAATGSFTLEVVATDVQGNTQQAAVSVSVVAAATVPAVPQTILEGGLDGTTLALNDTVDVVAQAVDSQGNALANAQFYLDGAPITTTPVGSDDAMRRAATVSAGSGTSLFYKASVPVAKPRQSLSAVGTTASGVSAVSSAATLYGKLNAGTPPTAAISGLNDGDNVSAGSAGQSVTVSASAGSLPIDHVDLYVDNMSVGTVTAAPYTFVLPALKKGSHSVSAKATDTSLLSKVSEPVIVKAEAVYVTPAFFSGQAPLGNGVYYLSFPNGDYFGYYSFLSDPHYIYHFDLGYEYVFDANDGKAGVYLYDFKSDTFFYTSPVFPFPYLYDFTLNTVLYYYPDPNNPGHYNTNGYRFFYDFATQKIIAK